MALASEEAPDWKAAAEAKRNSVNNLIPEKWRLTSPVPSPEEQKDVTGAYICQFLSEREVEITESTATEIAQQTTTGQLTALEVAEAFCHRAAVAHQLVNCLHEIFFDAALAQAKQLDDYFAQHKKPMGPLHGLPISLKDQFHVAGVETTMGYVGWIGTFEGRKGTGMEKVFESELVRELRGQGAVLYCKTSVPHSLMTGETINNIIGYTPNPHNRFLAAGGSSGGEGALIALKGSPLGVGSDIGGSIRIPAAFNGLYGLRPSGGRVPYQGVANSMDGQNSILSVLGPLASSARDLKLFLKSVLDTKPWLYDPLVVDLPWRESLAQEVTAPGKKLTFGILRSDAVAAPQPPVARALRLAAEALENAGHSLIDWKPPSHERAIEIIDKIWSFDGGRDVHGAFALSKEPISSQITDMYGEAPQPECTATQIAQVNIDKRTYQKEYMDYWNSTAAVTESGEPVDAFILPLAPFPAARPGLFHHYGYSKIFNLLDYSAAVLPVTTADKNIDTFDAAYKPFSDLDKKVWESYDADLYHGAPVAVQVVGRRLQEEKVIALTEIIASALRKSNNGAVSEMRM